MEDTIICSICREAFNSEQELRNHQQRVHAATVSNRRRFQDSEPDEDEQETAA